MFLIAWCSSTAAAAPTVTITNPASGSSYVAAADGYARVPLDLYVQGFVIGPAGTADGYVEIKDTTFGSRTLGLLFDNYGTLNLRPAQYDLQAALIDRYGTPRNISSPTVGIFVLPPLADVYAIITDHSGSKAPLHVQFGSSETVAPAPYDFAITNPGMLQSIPLPPGDYYARAYVDADRDGTFSAGDPYAMFVNRPIHAGLNPDYFQVTIPAPEVSGKPAITITAPGPGNRFQAGVNGYAQVMVRISASGFRLGPDPYGDGFWRLSVDGIAKGDVFDTYTTLTLTPGAHLLQAELFDRYGRALNPPVVAQATVEIWRQDTDGDGVPDDRDAFPLDAAAARDADGDGAPDFWNRGKSAADSTTGLVLDAFPRDAAYKLDADGDGLPDGWEITHFGDIYTAGTGTDTDGDGLLDVDEFVLGNDPLQMDAYAQAYTLHPGWNLIGLPYDPGTNGLAKLLAPLDPYVESVWALARDGSWDSYAGVLPPGMNGLTEVQAGSAYWVKIKAVAPALSFQLPGGRPAQPLLDGADGWRLITVPQVVTNVAAFLDAYGADSIWSFDGSRWHLFRRGIPLFLNDLKSLQPGRGYYIDMPAVAPVEITVQIQPPQGVSITGMTVNTGLISEASVDTRGKAGLTANAGAAQFITASGADGHVRLLAAAAFPHNGDTIVLDVYSTAQALLLMNPFVAEQLTGDAYADRATLARLAALTEVDTLAGEIAKALQADPHALDAWPTAMQNSYKKAVDAALVQLATVRTGRDRKPRVLEVKRPQRVDSGVSIEEVEGTPIYPKHTLILENRNPRYVGVYFENDQGMSLREPVMLPPAGGLMGDVPKRVRVELDASTFPDATASVKLYGPALNLSGLSRLSWSEIAQRETEPLMFTGVFKIALPVIGLVTGLKKINASLTPNPRTTEINADAGSDPYAGRYKALKFAGGCLGDYAKNLVFQLSADNAFRSNLAGYAAAGSFLGGARYVAQEALVRTITNQGGLLTKTAMACGGKQLVGQLTSAVLKRLAGPYGQAMLAYKLARTTTGLVATTASLASTTWYEKWELGNKIKARMHAWYDQGLGEATVSLDCRPTEACDGRQIAVDFGDGTIVTGTYYASDAAHFFSHKYARDGRYKIHVSFTDRDLASQPDPAGSLDTTLDVTNAPRIASVTPTDGARQVAANSVVRIAFDKPMDAATIDARSIKLYNLGRTEGDKMGQGSPVAASVAYDAATQTATLTPSSPLVDNHAYLITVGVDFNHPIQDTYGRALFLPSVYDGRFLFHTTDTLAPVVQSTAPVDGGVVDPAAGRVELTIAFNEPLADPTPGWVELRDAYGNPVPLGTPSLVLDGRELVVPVTGRLEGGGSYTARVTTQVKDAVGNALAQAHAFRFSAAPELGDYVLLMVERFQSCSWCNTTFRPWLVSADGKGKVDLSSRLGDSFNPSPYGPALAASPDGKFILWDDRLYDAATFQLIGYLPTMNQDNSPQFAAGTTIVYAAGGTIMALDFGPMLQGDPYTLSTLAKGKAPMVSPDGTEVAYLFDPYGWDASVSNWSGTSYAWGGPALEWQWYSTEVHAVSIAGGGDRTLHRNRVVKVGNGLTDHWSKSAHSGRYLVRNETVPPSESRFPVCPGGQGVWKAGNIQTALEGYQVWAYYCDTDPSAWYPGNGSSGYWLPGVGLWMPYGLDGARVELHTWTDLWGFPRYEAVSFLGHPEPGVFHTSGSGYFSRGTGGAEYVNVTFSPVVKAGVLPMDGGPLAGTVAAIESPPDGSIYQRFSFSPDSRWIAYTANDGYSYVYHAGAWPGVHPPALMKGDIASQQAFLPAGWGRGDTDGDGISDRDELFGGSDPAKTDTDGDGLNDKDELQAGSDPRNPDTDGDGLKDGAEATLGTDPTRADSDGDGVRDSVELAWGLDPKAAVWDTDGDGTPDPLELRAGTNPADPYSNPAHVGAIHGYDLLDVSAYRLFSSAEVLDAPQAAASGDNVTADLYAMPFPFPFYGRDVYAVGIDTNGNLWLGAGAASASRFTLANGVVGNPPVISVWNDDLTSYYYGDGGRLQAKGMPQRLVADWSVETNYDEDSNMVNHFQAVLYPNGYILLRYIKFDQGDNVDAGSGISAGTGYAHTSLTDVYGAAYNLQGRSFLFAPRLVGDSDADGLLDSYEQAIGTDPYSDDTNGDGLKDGWHVYLLGDDPLNPDTDGDGLSNALEKMLGTRAYLADTDGDGLSDGAEVAGGADPYAFDAGVDTDPLNPDTDGDHVSDGAEKAIGTDPLIAQTDHDGDGLTTSMEIAYASWLDPYTYDAGYDLDPTRADTDGDGLTDSVEIAGGADPHAYDWGVDTDPLNPDTDRDGLKDGVETNRGTFVSATDTGTDPLNSDTDGDGLSDGAEVALGSNPLLVDTDGDGASDLLEYAFAGAPADAAFVSPLYMVRDPSPATQAVVLGDVNGDGVTDFALGFPGASDLYTHAGRVEVRSGVDGGLLWDAYGQATHDALGWRLIAVRDIDGDGVRELAATAPFASDPYAGTKAGRLHLFSGADGTLLWRATGHATKASWGGWISDRWGQDVVADVGDVNGDGYTDLAIGATGTDDPFAGADAGEVQLLSGVDGHILWQARGAAGYDALGGIIAVAGDVNGDGQADVALGIPGSDAYAANAGEVQMRSGADGSLLWNAYGQKAGDASGYALTNIGDVNGDGVGDLAVGVQGADDPYTDAGRVEVRSGADGALLYVAARGTSQGEGLRNAYPLFDWNNDGVADFAVGSPWADTNAGTDAGRASVVSGMSGGELYRFSGNAAGDNMGGFIAQVGDVNGDGFTDVAIAASGVDDPYAGVDAGEVGVYSGRDGRLLFRLNGGRPNSFLSTALALPAGDINNDGKADILLIWPNYLQGTSQGAALLIPGR